MPEKSLKTKRTCPNGHTYYKSSSCPTCPICEATRKPEHHFLAALSAPARRALENKGITTLEKLSGYTKAEILALHGMGPSSIPRLATLLEAEGLCFKE